MATIAESIASASALRYLEQGFSYLLAVPEIRKSITEEHIHDTPQRVVHALQELLSGCFEDPEKYLRKTFSDQIYDELIQVADIPFVSLCGHHLLPFFGKIHFAYIPNKAVVGLSKIPRFISVLTHRPQVQERLTSQIVDTFSQHVNPKGCGVVIDAQHMCMEIRGAKCHAQTRTTALRGIFKDGSARNEFLHGVPKVR